MTNQPRYPVKATRTTFRVLEALAPRTRAGVTELATELDLSKSAVHNHLTTLEQLGYVVKRDGEYSLGLRFLEMGERARDTLGFHDTAKPEVDNLTKTTGEVATLHVMEQGREVCAYRGLNGSDKPATIDPGERRPIHSTAPGKAILAHLGRERVTRVLDRHGLSVEAENTLTDPERLRAELQRIRDEGVAFARGEHEDGLQSVAAPIRTGKSHQVAAIAVSGPTDRLSGKRLEEDVTGLVVSTAKGIEVELSSS